MNTRFIKTKKALDVIKRNDNSAYVKKHIKKYIYSASCTCCTDIVLKVHGYLLCTSLSNKELRDLGVKTNSPDDFYGCY